MSAPSAMKPESAMLHIRSLTKRYGERTALAQLSLDIGAGQLVALLGPNGAGKSTLFQVLTGLFVADEGEVEVAGHSLRHSAVAALRHIGVVFQQMSLDLDLNVERNLAFTPICTACRGRWRVSALPATARRWASRPIWRGRCASSRAATAARSSWCARCCTGRRWC